MRGIAVLAVLATGLLLAGRPGVSLADAESVVKKSRSGICHDQDSVHYERTQKFTPFESMEACLESGGRESRASPRVPLWRKIAVAAVIVLLILGGWYWLKRPTPIDRA